MTSAKGPLPSKAAPPGFASMSGKIEVDAVRLEAFGLADELRPGLSEWHTHQRHQLLYARAGTLRLEVARAQWLLPPQRAALIAANQAHRVRVTQRVSLRTVYLAEALLKLDGDCRVFAVT